MQSSRLSHHRTHFPSVQLRLSALLALGLALIAAGIGGTALAQPVPATEKRWVEEPTAQATTEPRLALVIGNTHYGGNNELTNPEADARAVADTLKKIGFTCTIVLDANRDQMRDEVDHFCDAVRGAGPKTVALLYYSGHGMQVNGENYLVPIGFQMPDRAENMGDYALSAQRVLSDVETANAKVRIIILDACRVNPFGKSKAFESGGGLAPLDAEGVLVAYATAPGKVARDDSLYRKVLVQQLNTPGLSLLSAFKQTQEAVYKQSASHQLPYVEDGLLGSDTFALLPSVLPPPQPIRPHPSNGGSGVIAAGTVKINPKDAAEMVYVPAGPFLMGDDDIRDNPRHTVTLSAFYIYKNDVTVAQYRAYCTATGKAMPDPPSWGWQEDHPIVNVSWEDARAYCAWAGSRLPTEAEWEKAARGDKGQKYPWGDDFDPTNLCCSVGTTRSSTSPVGSSKNGASPYGALDMAGNVWNWCEDGYDEHFMRSSAAHKPNPVNESSTGQRVLRGGSWNNKDTLNFRAAYRDGNAPTFRIFSVGFRCVAAAGPP